MNKDEISMLAIRRHIIKTQEYTHEIWRTKLYISLQNLFNTNSNALERMAELCNYFYHEIDN